MSTEQDRIASLLREIGESVEIYYEPRNEGMEWYVGLADPHGFELPVHEHFADLIEGVISDTHWGHDNIIRYCDRPEDHDWLMQLNWEAIVQPQEHVLHLGDVSLRKKNKNKDWIHNVHGHVHNDKEWEGRMHGRIYQNVSVEHTGYAPVRLRDVLSGAAGERILERLFPDVRGGRGR